MLRCSTCCWFLVKRKKIIEQGNQSEISYKYFKSKEEKGIKWRWTCKAYTELETFGGMRAQDLGYGYIE